MPYQQVTLAQFQTELLARFEAAPFWTSAEATLAINEGLRVWNLLTGMWRRRVTVASTSNTVWYAVPGTITYNTRMEFNGLQLEPTNTFDLDNMRNNWEGETTATSGLPTRPMLWTPGGLTLFAVWPADAAGANSFTIDGVANTPQLSAPTDYVDLGQDEHLALLNYSQHYLTFKEGGARFGATIPLYQDFLRACADKNLRLKSSLLFRKYMGLDLDRSQRPQRATITDRQQNAAAGG